MIRSNFLSRVQRLRNVKRTREGSHQQRSNLLPVAAFGSLALLFAGDFEDSSSIHQEPFQQKEGIYGEKKSSNHERVYTLEMPYFQSSYATRCDASSPQRHLNRSTSSHRIKNAADKRQLKSAYTVDWNRPLGEGGFGAVYAAVDKKTGEKVALKKISKKFTSDLGFQREMEAFLQIRANGGHPNICGLHDYFDEEGNYFLALDMISGGEMFDHLINSGPYSEADAARLVREVASALDFLHGIGIVHGDLKPENLMLSTENASDAVVKVIDFGTAQVLDEQGNPLAALGGGRTEGYCPPEVLRMKRITKVEPSMDMWALGVILFIMLVGAHPFDLFGEASEAETAAKIISGEPVPLDDCEYTTHLSEASKDLIRKLLAYRKQDRMTAHDLFRHPWVRGITASHAKIEESNKKLKNFRRYKTKLEAKVFEDMFAFSEDKSETNKKMSLMERSFRNLDADNKGFVTAKDVGADEGGNDEGSEDEALSLSGFTNLLSERMKNEYYKKGDIIYREGDRGRDMIFINSGVVEVSNKAGFKTTLKQGDFVGEGSLLSDKPRSGTVRCKTPVHAIKITKEYFDKYLSKSESGLTLKMLEKDKDRENSRIIFSAFSELLTENMKNEVFNEGDIVYHEGEIGHDVFFINSGVVEVSNKDGFRTTLQQGDFVGEGALLSNKPRSGTVKCLTEVHGMKITKEYFDKYLSSSDSSLSVKMREKDRERSQSRAKVVLRHHATDKSNIISISKGGCIFKNGDERRGLYILEEGEVELLVKGKGVMKLKPGDIFGEYSLVFDRPRNADAVCASKNCRMIEMSGRDAKRYLENFPSLSDAMRASGLRRDFQKAVVFKTGKEFPKTAKALKAALNDISPSGTITLSVVESLLRGMTPGIQDEHVKDVFDSIDINKNGSVDFATLKLIFELNS